MKLRLLTVLVARLGAGLVPAAPTLGASPTQNVRVPLAFTTDVSCTGEPIAFEGTMHLVLHSGDTANGSHPRAHANQHLEGVGLVTGARYIGVFSENAGSNVAARGQASNTTLVQNFHIIRQGESTPADDYSEHIFIHLTLTATGEDKAYADEFRSDCS